MNLKRHILTLLFSFGTLVLFGCSIETDIFYETDSDWNEASEAHDSSPDADDDTVDSSDTNAGESNEIDVLEDIENEDISETETEEEVPVSQFCTQDDDCLEGLEYCHRDNPSDSEGVCRNFCDLPGEECPLGFSCEDSGTCELIDGFCKNDVDCNIQEFCDKQPDAEGGVCTEFCFNIGNYCPTGCTCDVDGASTTYGQCLCDTECTSCYVDADCPIHQVCDSSPGFDQFCCIDICEEDSDCSSNYECCTDGRCKPSCNPCGDGCPPGERCDPDMGCLPIFDCPPCPIDHCCTAETAPMCVYCGHCENPPACGWGLPQCCPGSNCSVLPYAYGMVGFCQ